MRGDDEIRGLQPFGDHRLAGPAELPVATGADFVEQIIVEGHRHVDGEAHALLHAGRIGADRHIEELTDIGGLADIVDQAGNLVAVHAVDAPGEAGVLDAVQRCLQAGRQAHGRRYPPGAQNFALAGDIGAAEQAQECRFARAIGADDTDALVERQFQRHIAEHIVPAEIGRIIFADVDELDHRSRTFLRLA